MRKTKYDIDTDFKKIRWFKPPLNFFTVFLARVFWWLLPKGKKRADVKEKKLTVKSADGKKIKVIFYESKGGSDKKQPCLVYFHGGAFVYPAIWHHYRCARLYAANGVKVALVDYRLAPRFKYPMGADDCFAAYEYVVDNADSLGVRADGLILGGDSAGGFFVLTTLKRAFDAGLPLPKALMMIYPVVDSDTDNYSMSHYDDVPIWNSRANAKMWKYFSEGYCPVSPFDWTCYRSVKHVYVETAEYDCLRDRAIEFATKLKGECDDVVLHCTKGTVHGYDAVFDSEITRESVLKRLDLLKKIEKEKPST